MTRGTDIAQVQEFLCGGAAFALSFVQPESTETSHGFIASTIGVAAIAAGIRALALVRAGHSSAALAPLLGIIGGAIGTVVMAIILISFYFGPGPSPVTGALPEAVPRGVSVASGLEPAVFADAEAERLTLVGPSFGTTATYDSSIGQVVAG